MTAGSEQVIDGTVVNLKVPVYEMRAAKVIDSAHLLSAKKARSSKCSLTEISTWPKNAALTNHLESAKPRARRQACRRHDLLTENDTAELRDALGVSFEEAQRAIAILKANSNEEKVKQNIEEIKNSPELKEMFLTTFDFL